MSRVIFQQAALADNLLLFGEHGLHVTAAQTLLLHDELGENIFRLAQGEAQRRLQQPLAPGIVQVDPHVFELLDLFVIHDVDASTLVS